MESFRVPYCFVYQLALYTWRFRKANLQSIMKWMKVKVLNLEESLKFAQSQTSKG